MATDWANALQWGGAMNLGLPSEFDIARSVKNWTDYRNDVGRLDATQQNAALLSSLGYGGQALNDGSWSDDALNWLDSQGYQLGVGHQPGTSSGGRSEYFGLIDNAGKFVPGQSDPTVRQSDTLMDQITPFLLMAPMFAGIAAAGTGAAGAAGAGAGAGAGGGAAAGGAGAAGLGAGAEGLTALGSAWSPQALGLSLAPSTAAAEIAALSGALPGAVGAGAGIGELAMNGAIKGGVSGGGKALVQGENPLEGALKGAIGGAVTGGIGGGVNAINPDGVGWVNNAISGGINAGISGGNPVAGAVSGGAGSLLGSLGQTDTQQPTVSAGGGNMDFGGVGGWFDNWSPDDLNITSDIAGNVIPSNIGSDMWQPEWSSWVTDALSGLGGGGGDSSWLSGAIKGAIGGLGNAAGAVGGGQNLAALIGAGLGAASGGGTETSSRDPWAAAQPYLKNLLGDADAMRANMAANPLTAQQNTQFQQAFSGLDQARSAVPGLLNWGQQAMQRQSTTPSYDQLFSGGLLGGAQPQQPQQPTMQAGGSGGLLGNTQDDRLKALMARGRGLIG